MKAFPIPVRSIGPGSQPEEDAALSFLPLPSSINTFSMPQVPQPADAGAMTRARNFLAGFVRKMDHLNGTLPTLSALALDAAAEAILNEVLGEGEVSVRLTGGRDVRIQETVFAGVWRVRSHDDGGRIVDDTLLAGAIPPPVIDAALDGTALAPHAVTLPAGAMNSPALLAEIREQVRRRRNGAAAHVINLTLLPLTPDDHRVLEQALPVGSVAMISRGFGNCRITSTGTRNVWRVQYFNSMQTLILNTIEVVEVPEVALAAPDDLADSRTRLEELLEWMSESAAA
jgi:hydrogenase-1 operon protein HyaF